MTTDTDTDEDSTEAGTDVRRVPDGPRLTAKRNDIKSVLADDGQNVIIFNRNKAEEILTEPRVALLNYIRETDDPRIGDVIGDDTVFGLSDITMDDFNAIHKAGLIDYQQDKDEPMDVQKLKPTVTYDSVLVGPLV